MLAIERFQALLEEAVGLPFPEQIPILEAALETADASLGDQERADARVRLTEAYQFGPDPGRSLAPFEWLSERLDQQDPSVDEWEFHILWMNKWIVSGLLHRPDVPLTRIQDEIARMRRRYIQADEGLAPALKANYLVDSHVRGEASARLSYQAWVDAPRADLSDCEACEPTTRARHLAALGRHDDALASVAGVLTGAITCAEQPEAAICAILPSLVAAGRGSEIAELHALAWRRVRRNPGATDLAADLIAFCARTGNVSRGLELLRDRRDEFDRPSTPWSGMLLAASSARLLDALCSAGHGDLEITPGNPAGPLADSLRDRAVSTASEFDARNGTEAVSDFVRAILTSADLGPVDLGAVGRASLSGTPLLPERSLSPHTPDLSAITHDDVVALDTAAGEAWRWCGDLVCDQVTQRWLEMRERVLPTLEGPAVDAWRLRAAAKLETFGTMGLLDADEVERRARDAAELHRRAGLAGEALLSEQFAALAASDPEAVRSLGAEIERIGTVDEMLKSRRRLLMVAASADEASALLESMEALLARGGAQWEGRVSVALSLAIRLDESPEAALAAFDRGLALLEPAEAPIARGELLLARSAVLSELGRHAEAGDALAEASRLAWDSGDPSLWARTLSLRADAASAAGDLDASEMLNGEAAAAGIAHDDTALAYSCLGAQSVCLSLLNRPVQAAEVAEMAVALAGDHPPVRAEATSEASQFAENIGDIARARELAGEAVRAFAELPMSPEAVTALARLGHLEWRDGRAGESADTYAAALAQAHHLGHRPLVAAILRWRSNALHDSAGVAAALDSLSAAQVALDEVQSAQWSGSETASEWGDFNVDDERLLVRLQRSRLCAISERYAQALTELGDLADYAEDPELAEEAASLRASLLQDLADDDDD